MAAPDLSLLFENPAAQVLAHPAGYLRVVYQPGPRQLADLQSLLTTLGELLSSRNCCRLLADQRLLTPFTPEESEWIRLNWLTRSQAFSGAILLANDVFARLATSQLAHAAKESNLSYRFFEHEAAAEAWLLTQ